jgi:hypothetical protein
MIRSSIRRRMLDTGYWMLDEGYWILDTGCWGLDTGYGMFGTRD